MSCFRGVGWDITDPGRCEKLPEGPGIYPTSRDGKWEVDRGDSGPGKGHYQPSDEDASGLCDGIPMLESSILRNLEGKGGLD